MNNLKSEVTLVACMGSFAHVPNFITPLVLPESLNQK